MNRDIRQSKPRAINHDVVIKSVADEVLVYDLNRHRAHCLNEIAALVWKNCDGKKTVSEIAALLTNKLCTPIKPEVVWLALTDLRRANLLYPEAPRNSQTNRVEPSRRAFIRNVGITMALVPVVTSIIVPEAADAASVNCAAFTAQQPCENPLKACGTQAQFFCRWRSVVGTFRCICTNAL
jgi:hypothetical protein